MLFKDRTSRILEGKCPGGVRLFACCSENEHRSRHNNKYSSASRFSFFQSLP